MIKHISFFKILLVVALLLVVNTGMAQIVATQKLAILSDIHVTPGNANEGKLKEAVAEINGTDVDAVIVSGDLTNEGSDVQLRNVKSILDGITKPLYVIPGNHENNWSQSACKTFNDLWGNDRFVFTVGKLVVIGMNCGPFMKMGDGHIKQEDLTWLDKTLSEMVKPGMKVLSINHYPLLDDLDNYRDYAYILKKYPVITHVNGHWHRWRQYETDGIIGLMVRCLDMGDGDYGYTLMDVDLDHDWIHVYNKTLGKERDIRYAYKINLNYYSIDTRKIQYSVPQGFKVEKVYADNASIFTRLGIDKDNIYFGNSMGYLRVIDKKKAKLKWECKTTSMLFSRPAVADKVVILPTGDKRLIWLDKKTGNVLNEVAAEGPYVADGVVADGILYQGGFKTFQAWDVNTMKLLWEYTDINNYCQAEPFVGKDDIINIPSKQELDKSLVETLHQGGYELFQTFERYYNNHVEHRGAFNGEFATENDAQQIYDLLYANFIPYTDHLPSMSEIHDRIRNKEIFVTRDKATGKVSGLFSLTFEKQRCFFTLWINTSGDINESLSLYFNAFNYMHEKGYEKAYLWVREDNKFSKPIHLIHGFIFDGLKDYTFIKK